MQAKHSIHDFKTFAQHNLAPGGSKRIFLILPPVIRSIGLDYRERQVVEQAAAGYRAPSDLLLASDNPVPYIWMGLG